MDAIQRQKRYAQALKANLLKRKTQKLARHQEPSHPQRALPDHESAKAHDPSVSE